MRRKREVWPFLLSLGLFAVTFAGAGASASSPYAVPDEITLSAGPPPSASSQLFIAGRRPDPDPDHPGLQPPMPYWVFRGKVGDDGYH